MRSVTHQQTWKRAERQIANWFGGVRTPLSGSNSLLTAGDMIHPEIYAEGKYRARWAVLRVLDETVMHAEQEGKIPVVILREKKRHGMFLLCKLDLTVLRAIVKARVERLKFRRS